MKTYLLLAFSSAVLLGGCVSPSFYTVNEYQKHRQQDLIIPQKPFAVRVEADFSRNGQALPAANGELAAAVEKALTNTRIAIPYAHAENAIKITADNISDLKQALNKGFATGLTLGMAGNRVQDYYQFTCHYLNKNQALYSTQYNHALITAIGNVAPPSDSTVQSNPKTAFASITKDIVINCLVDLQKNGFLLPNLGK